MNIKYHLACGIMIDVACGTKGVGTLFSVFPDFPLIANEAENFWKHRKFDPENVRESVLSMYFITHSVLMPLLIYYATNSYVAVLAYGIHIVTDWFTHTGRFSSKPFYPFSDWAVKFGRDILK